MPRKTARGAAVVGLTGASVLLGGMLAPAAQAVDGGKPSMRVCANTAGKWEKADAKTLGDCHTQRAAYAAKRAELIEGKVPGSLAKEWGGKANSRARAATLSAARRADGEMTSGDAARSAMWAAIASGAARPVVSTSEGRKDSGSLLGGLSGSADVKSARATGDQGYNGAVLEARRAARAAWQTAKDADAAGGRDARRNIAADRAESRAWQTARAAGWLE